MQTKYTTVPCHCQISYFMFKAFQNTLLSLNDHSQWLLVNVVKQVGFTLPWKLITVVIVFCFVLLYFSVLPFMCYVGSKFTIILLSVSKDTSIIFGDSIFVIHLGKCFTGN